MRIGAAGNVGIGTSSPQNKLHVAGTIRSTSGFIGDIKSSNGTKVIDNGTDGTDAKYEGLFWSYGGNKYNTETGTTYTLVRDDAGITKRINNGSGTTITVPANATVAFPIGRRLYYRRNKMKIELSVDLVNKILNYLGSKPYIETAQIISEIQKEVQESNQQEENLDG
jgi:hypothetical protein